MTYVDSETISRLIIDKLISNVIIENKLKDVDLLFNVHIEKFIFELITPLMQSEFIFHENGLPQPQKHKASGAEKVQHRRTFLRQRCAAPSARAPHR